MIFMADTSCLTEAEDEVADKEHAEQAKQDFPDVFQYFHDCSFLFVDFWLSDKLFFGFLLTFSGVYDMIDADSLW